MSVNTLSLKERSRTSAADLSTYSESISGTARFLDPFPDGLGDIRLTFMVTLTDARTRLVTGHTVS
jgi:hypothetical protein